MTIVAAFEISRFITKLTRFTHEIFAFFVCSIYIEDGISSVINRFQVGSDKELAASLFQVGPTVVPCVCVCLSVSVCLPICLSVCLWYCQYALFRFRSTSLVVLGEDGSCSLPRYCAFPQ